MLNINGEKIRNLRESKGLTQLYVATYVGVTTDTVSRWENQHYQTVKKENAKKLAESLEVSLEEILENGSNAALSGTEESVFSLRAAKIKKYWIGLSLILAGMMLLIWLWQKGWQPASGVVVQRRMPSHVPPGSTFPVTIRIENNSGKAVSLIITERPPRGVTVSRGEPPFQSRDPQKGVVKWIVNSNEKTMFVSYLAAITGEVETIEDYIFSGSVLVRQGKEAPIRTEGDNTIKTAMFHWADINMDNRIDDKEILTVFDNFNAFAGVDSIRSKVEDIWAGNGYRWDKEKREYSIIP
jgi:transcriptional regulator with XRE-family HTH domain